MTVTWIQDPDLTTYRAKVGRTELTVHRLGLDLWRPEVQARAWSAIGPTVPRREEAQQWCEREAGVNRHA